MESTCEKYGKHLTGKKLLILGGASQHCKIVEAAHELGVITYVADFLEHAPAKEMGDYSYLINVTETEKLARLCEKEGIDGILSGWLDFIQPYYQRLCEQVNLPCYGSREQFDVLTKKTAFKDYCLSHNVGVPEFFPLDKIDEYEEMLPYPVFVKPSDSRGSRGLSICRDKTTLLSAIEKAKKESYDGEVIAERYIEKGDAFLVVYFFVDGKAYVQQLSDAYFGNKEDGLDKVNVAYRSPFSKADRYMKIANDRFIKMLKSLGVENGPVCMQGFLTDDDALFFDPGRRFPGGEYERVFKRLTGIDMVKGMVVFALTGKYPLEQEPMDDAPYLIGGKTSIRLQINVCAGTVEEEKGFDKVRNYPEVEYVAMYHTPGEVIEATGNTHQRYGQVVIAADNTDELIKAINRVYSTIDVIDVNGNSMLRSLIDTDKLRNND
jgi:biotin carboxylase